MDQNLQKRALGGMIWKFLEKICGQGMQLVIQIVLARLLLPEEYGLVGLLTIFITISDVFILQGLTTALIQKKSADEKDYSSVFFANIAMSCVLYAILFLIAPIIASFYNEPSLTDIMRVLSLNVLFGAFAAVPNAILSRKLDFKKSFIRNISNVSVQGIVGITFAFLGAGAWAMVYSKVFGTLVGALVLMATVDWWPKLTFSFERVKKLFSFSSKVLATNLLNTVFNNIHSLIIGKAFNTAELGYYQRGQQTPQVAMTSLDGSMTEVLYPTFSKLQNDVRALKAAVSKSISASMFIVLPAMFGMMAIAEPLTLVLLTEKWLPSVPFMQLSCIICMFWPLAHRTHALNALGKSNVTLKLSLIGKGITLLMIFVCIPMGIYAIMLGTIVAATINLFITSYYVKKYIGYSILDIVKDVLPTLILSAIMAGIVYSISLLPLIPIVTLIVQLIVGVVTYVVLCSIFKPKPYKIVINMAKGLLANKLGRFLRKTNLSNKK